jgi:AcrR family transcriptional regulator
MHLVRQARSAATRQKIVNAAVDLFDEVGYPTTGLGDIVRRAEVTKGAFYHHFDSKESLASAIIDQAVARIRDTFRSIAQSSAPALESLIHSAFVIGELAAVDKAVRVGTQLKLALGQFNDRAASAYDGWRTAATALVTRASEEGDLRDNLEPVVVAESIVAVILGAETLGVVISGGKDLAARLDRVWGLLLPGLVTDESLPYYREYLAREAMRHLEPGLSI